MKGDFSRSTFNPLKHYSSVRMQQGRVQLDADWNEQADILLYLIRTQLGDMLGRGATASAQPGFAITLVEPAEKPEDQDPTSHADESTAPARVLPDFWIGKGCYYVEGIQCENEDRILFSHQPDYPAAGRLLHQDGSHNQYQIYLDVWEQHITAIEDPEIREVALGGPDTTTRLKTVWQVKLLPLGEWTEFEKKAGMKRMLMVRRNSKAGAVENRMYRVEIHTVEGDRVTFKWSRENGSVVFPITEIKPSRKLGNFSVTVEDLDRDPYLLQEGSWVEIADDITVLNGIPLPLCKVIKLDHAGACVTLQPAEGRLDQVLDGIDSWRHHHPLLRRWENDGETVVPPPDGEGNRGQNWLELENGIRIAFNDKGSLQPGDYWLIPARMRLDDGIEWPQKSNQPLSQPPHGTRHSYAPLALLEFDGKGWSASPVGPAVFQSLPEITGRLSPVFEQLQNAFTRLDRVQENVESLVQQEHVFETVITEDELEYGAVVSLDRAAIVRMGPAETGGDLPVRLASASDAGMVLGVVWDAIEGDGNSRRYRVVLHGRVRCKVLGLVEPGDMLVPADKLGYARKADQRSRPGSSLGKALGFTMFEPEVMEEVEDGTRAINSGMARQPGSVDVLVSLG